MLITSRQNPKIKTLVGLRQRRQREAAGVTLVDGFEELKCALTAGVAVQQLFYCPELMGDGQQTILQELLEKAVEAYELNREVFE